VIEFAVDEAMQAETSWINDGDAFQAAAEALRYQLQVHCYRMLGSLHEAEDLVQETYLRAWRARERFEGRTSFKNWLYRIATNACLNAIAQRKTPQRIWPDASGPPADGPLLSEPATDVAWLEPYPDAALENVADDAPGPDARYELQESIHLAFIAAIQQLPARQRAVLLLRDVLGWSAAETAQLLDSSVASVNSALQRARATLERHTPAEVATPELAERDLLERYVQTWETNDMDALAALLREDAVLRMPPWPQWYRGRQAIRDFFVWIGKQRGHAAWRVVRTGANGQPAFAHYVRIADADEFVAHNIQILTLDGDVIGVLTAFRDPELFAKFGLPPALPNVTS
jgi:RNA polymerase sigma-70 factor (ECF subfamily)